ncbi:LLM class flavin-dependent oxidoreductase [Amycolatopsis samaneae]|uniref:LLM class flavin-dependent oxidoreductase n=1 Tax=Amycolatopsis samaneae TaxID=664691 RepID=A0ABW5GR30_9PSEU
MPSVPKLHLAVALDAAGWHPAAWREPDARPAELFTARYWADLVGEAERGLLDFVTIEDSLGVQSSLPDGFDDRADQVRGRLDAVLVASRIAPLTQHIGLVPTAIVTHTEPFHLSKAIATLDYVSNGRGGLRAQVAPRHVDAAHFGRRELGEISWDDVAHFDQQSAIADLLAETEDYVEVVRRLWDSWEDDAEIRDVATGRFVDREKLHYIDFAGRWFSVRGPSITPRPPQGQPLVVTLAHSGLPYRVGARAADVVVVTPRERDEVRPIVDRVRAEQEKAGRAGERVHVFADLLVFLDETESAAAERKARLDAVDGTEYTSDTLIFTGTAAGLADRLLAWRDEGLSGFRLRPGAIPHDLEAITRALVPELRARGAFRDEYEATTLRGLLGLPRPANRYAA